jgi:PilZ domain
MTQIANKRRKTLRTRVLRGGVISFHHRGSDIECTVRDLSDAGACLLVESPVGIPDEFDLVLDCEKTPRHCRALWTRANKIGVEFH